MNLVLRFSINVYNLRVSDDGVAHPTLNCIFSISRFRTGEIATLLIWRAMHNIAPSVFAKFLVDEFRLLINEEILDNVGGP